MVRPPDRPLARISTTSTLSNLPTWPPCISSMMAMVTATFTSEPSRSRIKDRPFRDTSNPFMIFSFSIIVPNHENRSRIHGAANIQMSQNQHFTSSLLSATFTALCLSTIAHRRNPAHRDSRLVPPHARKELLSRGIDIDNFMPMSQEEMMAHLE